MKDYELRELAGADVMTWNLNNIPFAVSEARGPLVVSLKGETVKWYPWWAHPLVDNGSKNRGDAGKLWIRDPRKHMRVIGEHDRGT